MTDAINDATEQRTIKHKVFIYHIEQPNVPLPDGTIGTQVVERMARRGETVMLREADANRGDSLDAFYTDAELSGSTDSGPESAPPAPQALQLETASVDEIRAWLMGEGPGPKPSIPQVINAINAIGDDDRNQVIENVLEAENSKTGSDPRKTLVEPLEEALKEPEPDPDPNAPQG
jgi:hypothetical protein